ncbi:hypothetical protein [Ferrimonas balearica]|uniref:hypothetical protein n=1 Tax=Ferrimonas balearica TaxID=44012 RepID=UPI001C93FC9F|nr:hypothetical protein [Ferrimonas balearica]MBY6223082.1 hypothetical protein [Ferrimonas balearica]
MMSKRNWLLSVPAMVLAMFSALAQATDCSEVQWHADVLAAYPGAAKACQAVVMRDGEERVEVKADFVAAHANGKITLDVHENDGTKERMDIRFGRDVKLNDQVDLDRLPRGYELTLYIPHDRFEIVQAVSEEPVEIVEEVVVAEVVMLPDTASPWYLLATLGLGLLGLSLALRLRR